MESTSCFAMVLWFLEGDGLCFFGRIRSINARTNFLSLSKKLWVEVGSGMVGVRPGGRNGAGGPEEGSDEGTFWARFAKLGVVLVMWSWHATVHSSRLFVFVRVKDRVKDRDCASSL